LLLDAIGQNRRLMEKPGRRQDLAYLLGYLSLEQGQAQAALADFNRAIDQQVRVEAALKQAALLGGAGHPELGLAHLAHYDVVAATNQAYHPPFGMARLHAWVLERQGYWDRELERLRATLRQDARNKRVSAG
jgi:hypothetical protein